MDLKKLSLVDVQEDLSSLRLEKIKKVNSSIENLRAIILKDIDKRYNEACVPLETIKSEGTLLNDDIILVVFCLN